MRVIGVAGVGLLLACAVGKVVQARAQGAPVQAQGTHVTYVTLPQDLIERRLDRYKGDDRQREDALRGMFAEAGCKGANLREQAVPKLKLPNVICVLPGSTNEMVVVGAHYDHAELGQGVVDNWSGASLLPSLYGSLHAVARQKTFVFVGFAGEEKGLVGSDFYVESLTPEETKQIEVMVNLDSLGLGPTKLWMAQSDPVLANLLAGVGKVLQVPVTGAELNGFGESDEESFIARGICTVVVHSLTPETAHVLHHLADNPKAIRFAEYYDTYRLLAAYLAVLDTHVVPEPHVCPAKVVEMYQGGRVRRGGANLGTRR